MNKYKGVIKLIKNSKVFKTAKNQIEIPTEKKTYILIEPEQKRQSIIISTKSPEKNIDDNIRPIDDWIETLNNCIDTLK